MRGEYCPLLTSHEDIEWLESFRAEISDLPETLSGRGATPEVASARLRSLVSDRALSLSDVRDAPRRFFAAHNELSRLATRLGPGFGIRFTVQYNLFAGSIVALGSEAHLELLKHIQSAGELGCFALTEKFAGVNSGLVVETTCTWEPAGQQFVLHSPYEGAYKNWISQGCTADWAVVVADLVVADTHHGPHAFLMRLRTPSGQLVQGVTATDMGGKTIGNDLDNAALSFDRVRLPKSALLNRFCDIEGEGAAAGRYMQRVEGVANIDMIGQRLYTGRLVIADSAVTFAKCLFESTREYIEHKMCWAPKGSTPLSEIPQLKALYSEAGQSLSDLQAFLLEIQQRMAALLSAGKPPPPDIVDAIAAGKVRCIEKSIELCHRLKQEVGSFALMAGTGFERTDYLQCCKFAEGDSRILMQKLARDRLRRFMKAPRSGSAGELRLCADLASAMKAGGAAAWDANWQKVYALAEMVIDRTFSDYLPGGRLHSSAAEIPTVTMQAVSSKL